MKRVNTAFLTAVFLVAAGSVSAATDEPGSAARENAPLQNLSGRQLVFNKIVANHVDRVIAMDLRRQASLAVNSVHEAPTVIASIEIEIEKNL